MATIDFSALPTSKNGKNFKRTPAEPCVYRAKVVKVEIKTSKTGNEYLSVHADLEDRDGNKKGRMFDMIMVSDKSFILYKLRRFCEACKIPMTGQMELKDIGLLVNNAEYAVWTDLDEWNGDKRVIPNFKEAEGYYPIEDFEKTYEIWCKVNGKEVAPIPEPVWEVPEGAEEIPFSDEDEF